MILNSTPLRGRYWIFLLSRSIWLNQRITSYFVGACLGISAVCWPVLPCLGWINHWLFEENQIFGEVMKYPIVDHPISWPYRTVEPRMGSLLKCRKCRHIIVTQEKTSILNPHNDVVTEINNSVNLDCGGKIIDVWYLQETEVPDWIIACIDEADWQRGKLVCPHCKARIGSFDFISGLKCTCKQFVVPSIHLVKSKIDVC